MSDELKQVLNRITEKRVAQQRAIAAAPQTKFRRASHIYWQYGDTFIRGKDELIKWNDGRLLPHVYESSKAAYLMSGRELQETGYKAGEAGPVAHTYNAKAKLYYLTDIRHCQMIGGDAAAKRRKKAKVWAWEVVQAMGSDEVETFALLANKIPGWRELLTLLERDTRGTNETINNLSVRFNLHHHPGNRWLQRPRKPGGREASAHRTSPIPNGSRLRREISVPAR